MESPTQESSDIDHIKNTSNNDGIYGVLTAYQAPHTGIHTDLLIKPRDHLGGRGCYYSVVHIGKQRLLEGSPKIMQ